MTRNNRRTSGTQSGNTVVLEHGSGATVDEVSPSWEKWIGLDQPGDPWPWDMEEDAWSVLAIRLAEHPIDPADDDGGHHRAAHHGCQGSILQQLKAKFSLGAVALLLCAVASVAHADAQEPVWSDPKIPAPFARVLEARGQLDLVDQVFDRIAYYPWPAFATENGGETAGLAYTLENGEHVAYIATQGRKYREVTDTLVELAQQMRPRHQPRAQRGSFPAGVVFIGVVALVIIGMTVFAAHNSHLVSAPTNPQVQAKRTEPRHRRHRAPRQLILDLQAPVEPLPVPVVQVAPAALQEATPARTTMTTSTKEKAAQAKREARTPQPVPTPKSTKKEEAMSSNRRDRKSKALTPTKRPEVFTPAPMDPGIVQAPVPSEPIPWVFGVDRVVDDLERVVNAGWLTRGWTKSGIFRDVGNQTEILESYSKYFAKANEVLRSRRDLEQTKREILDFEASQVLRQKRLQVEYAQLDAQEAKAWLEKAYAEAAREVAERSRNCKSLGEREDYDL